MKVTGILLAAGESSRMNLGHKLLLPFRLSTIIEESLKQMLDSPLSQIIVVLGHEAEKVQSVLKGTGSNKLKIVINDEYRIGRGSSIRKGIENIDETCDTALFMVADKPAITDELIDHALSTFKKHHPRLLCVRTPEGRGHPVIFDQTLFDELREMNSDDDGQAIFDRHAKEIFWLSDGRLQINVNTTEDYRRLLEAENVWGKATVQRSDYD